jgi:hypothetical protein
MGKKLERYQIIVCLLLIILIMSLIKIKYGYKGKTTEQTKPNPSVTLVPTLKKEEINTSDYPLWKQLPYQGEGFIVDRYIAPKTLAVRAKGLDKILVAKAIGVWLEAFGDLGKDHKIQFEN